MLKYDDLSYNAKENLKLAGIVTLFAGLIGSVGFLGYNIQRISKNEGMQSASSITAPYREGSNEFQTIVYKDGTKVPMIQLPDGSWTNYAGYCNAKKERITAEEKDITKKLTEN